MEVDKEGSRTGLLNLLPPAVIPLLHFFPSVAENIQAAFCGKMMTTTTLSSKYFLPLSGNLTAHRKNNILQFRVNQCNCLEAESGEKFLKITTSHDTELACGVCCHKSGWWLKILDGSEADPGYFNGVVGCLADCLFVCKKLIVQAHTLPTPTLKQDYP